MYSSCASALMRARMHLWMHVCTHACSFVQLQSYRSWAASWTVHTHCKLKGLEASLRSYKRCTWMGGLLDGVGGSQAGSPPCVVAFGGMCARVGWAAAFFQDIYNPCRGRLEQLLIKVSEKKQCTLAWNGICIYLIFAAMDATDWMSSCRLLFFHPSNPTSVYLFLPSSFPALRR